MGWLRLVGFLNSYVSFAKEPYKRDVMLQKRQIISRSLLIVATPYTFARPRSEVQGYCRGQWCHTYTSYVADITDQSQRVLSTRPTAVKSWFSVGPHEWWDSGVTRTPVTSNISDRSQRVLNIWPTPVRSWFSVGPHEWWDSGDDGLDQNLLGHTSVCVNKKSKFRFGHTACVRSRKSRVE